MKYFGLSLLYWPIWAAMNYMGYPVAGIFIAAFVSLAAMVIAWRLEFGDWDIFG